MAQLRPNLALFIALGKTFDRIASSLACDSSTRNNAFSFRLPPGLQSSGHLRHARTLMLRDLKVVRSRRGSVLAGDG